MSLFKNTTPVSAGTKTVLVRRSLAGTVAYATDGLVVTGTGTNWSTSNLRVGDYINIGAVTRVISAINSTTSLTVKTPFTSTVTGQAYTIDHINSRDNSKAMPILIQHEGASGTIKIGVSENATKDGTDVTDSSRSKTLNVGYEVYLETQDLRHVYIWSNEASTPYSITFLI